MTLRQYSRSVIREGSGEPLVLLHGITATATIWRRVVPLLAPYHDTVALTAPGHHGGDPWPEGVRHGIGAIADDVERRLDELGFETAHVAGNSMGGWLALELARRGRARTVTALSPGGSAAAGSEDLARLSRKLERMVKDVRRFDRLLPFVARRPRLRRQALLLNAEHGERVSPADFLASARGTGGCTVHRELLAASAQMEPIDPPPCPITVAWSEHDRVLPLKTLGQQMRELVPGAEFIVLPGVGHVPMFDDPALVARTILERTGASLSTGRAPA